MTGTDLATNTNPDVPTLIELIDGKATSLGNGASVAFAGGDFSAIRDAAVALETEYALARAELSTKAAEYLQVFRQMEQLQDILDLESRDADAYAKKAHDADDMVVTIMGYIDATRRSFLIADELLGPMITKITKRVADRPKRTIITKESAPLVALEA